MIALRAHRRLRARCAPRSLSLTLTVPPVVALDTRVQPAQPKLVFDRAARALAPVGEGGARAAFAGQG